MKFEVTHYVETYPPTECGEYIVMNRATFETGQLVAPIDAVNPALAALGIMHAHQRMRDISHDRSGTTYRFTIASAHPEHTRRRCYLSITPRQES